MEPNTSSPDTLALGAVPAGLEALAADIAQLADQDPADLPDALLAEQTLALHRLRDRLDGLCMRRLAHLDGRGAAGAEAGAPALSTAAWLRAATCMGATAASRCVRTARALYRGPLRHTGQALADGDLSYEHAAVLSDAAHDLPPSRVVQAEPVLLDAARRLDPPRLRQLGSHLRQLLDPDRADQRERRRLEQRGLWLAGTFDGMLALQGLLDAEAGEAVQAALAPLARPTGPDDPRTAAQRRADALGELAHQALQGGRLPQAGGQRPQLTVTVDVASLLAGDPVGGSGGWGTALPAEVVRRLACDATLTRAVVRRHPHPTTHDDYGTHPGRSDSADPDAGLAARLRAGLALLPPPLGAPTQLLDLGRATRVVPPALRRALAVRDGGCVAAGCGRPAPWTDAHHLLPWLQGGPTSLDNLVLLCRSHHRAVHELGWRARRDPASGQVTVCPPADALGRSPPPR
jgi:Domain of unknown function (DUF222)/HNH endonuclease